MLLQYKTNFQIKWHLFFYRYTCQTEHKKYLTHVVDMCYCDEQRCVYSSTVHLCELERTSHSHQQKHIDTIWLKAI